MVAQPLTFPTNSSITQMDAPGEAQILDPSLQQRPKTEADEKAGGRGRSRQQKDNKDGSSEGSPDGGADGYSSATDRPPRKRRRAYQWLDKKLKCPQEGCEESFSRAEHLDRHYLNHPAIYSCDFPGCVRSFSLLDLYWRHRYRHTVQGSQLHRKDSSLGQTHASPATESGEPLRTTVGPYGPLPGASSNQNYHGTHSSMQSAFPKQNLTPPPSSLPPPAFNTVATSTSTGDPEPMGQLTQQLYEEFVSMSHILYNADRLTSYPDSQNQYYAPYFANEISPGGFFPANQQPHNPMAVTSLLNPSQSDMEIVQPEIMPIPSAGDPLPNLPTNGVDVLFDHQSYERVVPDDIVSPMGSVIWDNSSNPGVQHDAVLGRGWWTQDAEKIKEDGNEGTITDPRSIDLAEITINGEWSRNDKVKSPSNIIRQGTPSDAWPREYDEDEELRPANRQLLGTGYKAPFTDSGYASLPNLNHSSHIPTSLEKSQFPANTEPSTTINDIDREDARTSYSATTTVGPAHAQVYIAELCSDICGKLGSSFDAKLWSTLSGALPGLIKAFAIKIGYDSSAQVNQDIMYFIHKRHEDVITQLKAMSRQQDDDEPDSCRDGHEGMSLRDKMSMWENKAVEDDSVVESGDLYQGVKDDEDEIIDGIDLLSYRNTILNSAAYKWLLASLRKESSLQWSATHPSVMIESIRLRILDKLPTGKISKRRPLNVYEVRFDLQWGTGIEGRLEDELLDRLEIPGRSFAEFVTVTGSPEEAQALTIKEYLSQTWPGSGLRLLDILQKTIDHYGHQYSVKFPDKTQLEARISGSRLILTATGPAHFIAECGEQLAWLRAALLGSSRRFIVYCTPSITTYLVDPISSISEKSKYKGHCSIGFDISHVGNRGDSTTRAQNCWQALVGESVVILGFPIARRPEACPGLELSFHRLLCFLGAKNTTITNGRVILKGPEKALQLMKHSDNVFLWHPLHNPDEVCSCCMDHHIKVNVGIPSGSIDPNILNAGRHILNNCADFLTPISDNISPSRIFEKPSMSRATFAQHHLLTKANPLDSPRNLSHNLSATDLNGSLSMLHPHENDESVSRPLITSGVIRSVAEDCLLNFHTKHWESHSSSNDQNTLMGNSQSIVTTGSADESLDSDLLSISDYSEQHEPLDSNEPAYSFLNTLLQKLLSGFQSTTQTQLSPSGNGEGAITPAPVTGSSTTSGTSRQCRKRGRDETDDDDAGQDGFLRPPRKKINPGQGKASQRSLACPYLKFDPIKHRSCCAKQLTRIRDVKQHLSRRHTPERYCQRCLETNFLDELRLDSHMILNTCPLKDRALLEGLSHQQQRQLSRKSNSNLSEEDQWFAIWEITFPKSLFPELRRPISAYMDTGLSMDMRLFREYCSNYGPSTLTEQIESDPAWSRSEITAEQRRVYLDRVILQGINSLFEGYLRSNISSESAPSPMQNRNNMHPTPTPTGSIADSGVALESQLSSGEASYQEGLVDQLPSTGRLGYQPTVGDDRVQGNSTIQESAIGPSQTHRGSILDMNPPDMFPPDTSFDFSQVSDFGSPNFADDAFQYLQDY